MKRLLSIFLFLSAIFGGSLKADLRPSFALDYSSWKADHILVIEEGNKVDGIWVVVESLRGEFMPGELLELDELADPLRPDPEADDAFLQYFIPDSIVDHRVILFLEGSRKNWQAAAHFSKDLKLAAVWVEQGKCFAFQQVVNPGPVILAPLNTGYPDPHQMTEKEVWQQAQTIGQGKSEILSLEEAPKEKAVELVPYLTSSNYYLRQQAHETIRSFGWPGVLVIQPLLVNPGLVKYHGELIITLGETGGKSVGPILNHLLMKDLNLWQEEVDSLTQGWWNFQGGVNRDRVLRMREVYFRTLMILRAMKNIEYYDDIQPVANLRKFWRSHPQLNDRNGINQMSLTCDEIIYAARRS